MNADPAVGLQEALAKLADATGHRWSRFEFFLLVTHCRLELRAAAPQGARTITYPTGKVDGARSSFTALQYPLAIVSSVQVRQLWASGKSTTEQPSIGRARETMRWFAAPVTVTFDTIRVRQSTLTYLASLWHAEKISPFALSNLPDWLWTAARDTISGKGAARPKGMTTGRTAARRLTPTVVSRQPIEASRRHVGRIPFADALAPRVHWLMNQYFDTRADWFVRKERDIRKSDLESKVFVRLASDGTLGVRRAKIGTATIRRLTGAWCLPASAKTTPLAPPPRRLHCSSAKP